MCGSGTPAIEAALFAMKRAPGSFKSHFAFMAIKGYRITIPGEQAGASVRQRFGASPEQIWKDMVSTAHANEITTGLPPIIATDIDPEAVETAHTNAIAAGVAQHITFGTCDFATTRLPPAPGTIFLNPEYGERLGSETDLEPLYSRIGDFFKQKCTGYTGCVLTGNMEMSRKIGLRSIKRIPFFNGPIECRMVVFDLYEGTEKE
jgi:putative N6-adenine-specific DNA methylase